MHVVRTHNGADDASYACVHQAEDGDGRVGVRLSKDLLAVAGATLKANITTLGPLVLPVPEQARQGRGGGGGQAKGTRAASASNRPGQPTVASPPATSPTTAHPPIYSAVVPGQPGGPQAAGVEGAAIRPRL